MVAASPAPPSCCGCRNPGPQAREKGKRHGFDLASINTTLTCSLVDSLSSAPPPPLLLFTVPHFCSHCPDGKAFCSSLFCLGV